MSDNTTETTTDNDYDLTFTDGRNHTWANVTLLAEENIGDFVLTYRHFVQSATDDNPIQYRGKITDATFQNGQLTIETDRLNEETSPTMASERVIETRQEGVFEDTDTAKIEKQQDNDDVVKIADTTAWTYIDQYQLTIREIHDLFDAIPNEIHKWLGQIKELIEHKTNGYHPSPDTTQTHRLVAELGSLVNAIFSCNKYGSTLLVHNNSDKQSELTIRSNGFHQNINPHIERIIKSPLVSENIRTEDDTLVFECIIYLEPDRLTHGSHG